MSELQRLIVRMGVEADVPALHFGELGMDTDTITVRIGDDTADPPKIMTTKSKGSFDYSNTDVVTFNQIEFAPGGGVSGIDFDSLTAEKGIVISIGNGQFREAKISSSDGSIVINNGDGQAGDIDLTISTDSLLSAFGDIKNSIISMQDQIQNLSENANDDDDTLLKLIQLTGEPAKKTDLGNFLGSIIPDGSTIRTALQSLETAIQNVDSSAFHLDIVGRDQDKLGLQLTPDNIVILEGATHEFAGLMTADDQLKLDMIDLNELNAQGITSISYFPDNAVFNQTNEVPILMTSATTLLAGLMISTDKLKLDQLTSTVPHNLDQMDTDIETLKSTLSTSFFIETADEPLFSTGDRGGTQPDPITTFNVPLAGLKAFGIYFNRAVDGYDAQLYDELHAAGQVILESEHVTKTYIGAIVIYQARDKAWYYLNKFGFGVKLAEASETNILVDAGLTNEFVIRKLTIV